MSTRLLSMLLSRQTLAVQALVAGVFALQLSVHPLGTSVNDWFDTWIFNLLVASAAVTCFARVAMRKEDRLAWALIATGVTSWLIGNVYWYVALGNDVEPSYPSVADLFYILFYPPLFVAIVVLMKKHLVAVPRSFWLSGLIAALSLGALDATVVIQAVSDTNEGSMLAVATNMIYPLADLLLLMFVVYGWSLSGWRPSRSWLFLGVGLIILSAADSAYLYAVATGSENMNYWIDAMWPIGFVVIAAASRHAEPWRRAQKVGSNSILLPTAVFSAISVAVLTWDHFQRLSASANLLAAAALVVAIVQMVVAMRENARVLGATLEQATTDEVTQIYNRYRFNDDLRRTCDAADLAAPSVLVYYDLNGFKTYNDQFGHSAGDSLLRRLGLRLAAAADPYGTAYRLGGDEFCVLARADGEQVENLVAITTNALVERGEGFETSSAFGYVLIPAETCDPEEALKIADQRMYTQKYQRSGLAARDVESLIKVMQITAPRKSPNTTLIVELAKEVADRLGADEVEVTDIGRACELRDIGYHAIPEEILNLPGLLDEHDWALMRGHTIVGERILGATPTLECVAKIVRHSHEHYDGDGYPDRLVGDAIPRGSRIVAVCDAFDAMICGRPYRQAISVREALDELIQCAGSQFDPDVVNAFLDCIDTRRPDQFESVWSNWDGTKSAAGHSA